MTSRAKLDTPKWLVTPEVIEDQLESWRSKYPKVTLKNIPLRKVFYLSFGEKGDEYSSSDCPVSHGKRTHAEHVKYLADLMRQGVPMSPPIGYLSGGFYVANDGNHRICAAKRLGIKTIPMLVKDEP